MTALEQICFVAAVHSLHVSGHWGECGPSEECHIISAVYSSDFRICPSLPFWKIVNCISWSQAWMQVAESIVSL